MALKAEIANEFAKKSQAEWVEVFANYDVCVEPVLTAAETVHHPQTVARGLIVEVPKPDGSSQKQVASPLKFSGSEAGYSHIGPDLGRHTRDVLTEIGYSPSQIDQMQEQGLFG